MNYSANKMAAKHCLSVQCIVVDIVPLNTIGRNLLTTHFLASPHVYGTIEGLILVCYDWLFDLTSVCIKSTSVL
jgi:hypothetical protein